MVVDKDQESIYLQALASGIKKDEGVWLIDHLWSFKYGQALSTLTTDKTLRERLLNITRFSDKMELPSNPYSKSRPSLEEYLATITQEVIDLELDDYDLTTFASVPLHENVETISFFNNEIENPNEIVEHLLPLPKLKGAWLQGNPVVTHCVNFL